MQPRADTKFDSKYIEKPISSEQKNVPLTTIQIDKPKIYESDELNYCIKVLKKAESKSRKAAWAIRIALLTSLSLTIYLISRKLSTPINSELQLRIHRN